MTDAYCCEANVRVCFDLNFRIQLLFPFDSFDGYFPDCLTFSCCSKITSFNLGLGLTLKDFISLIGFPFYLWLRTVVLFFPVSVFWRNQFLSLVGTIWPWLSYVYSTL